MRASPSEILREEHRVILHALQALQAATVRVAAGRPLPDGWWPDLIRWLRGFADRNHHAKEERVLFPAMVKAGVPTEGGPVGVMLEEHAHGRALVRAMEAAGPAAGVPPAREYVEFLRGHIAKENDVLFPLADAFLDEATLQVVGREFEEVEAALGREADLEAAEAELTRLTAALDAPGVSPAR